MGAVIHDVVETTEDEALREGGVMVVAARTTC